MVGDQASSFLLLSLEVINLLIVGEAKNIVVELVTKSNSGYERCFSETLCVWPGPTCYC